MDLEMEDVAHAFGKFLGVLALMLNFIVTPILWVLGTFFRAATATSSVVFSAVSSVVYGILRIVTSPFLIPWHIAVGVWELAQDMYDEVEPLLIYLSVALVIGAVAGTLIAIITNTTVKVLRSWFPFLRPRPEHSTPTHRHSDGRRDSTKSSILHRSKDSSGSDGDKERRGGNKDKHADSALYWSSSDDASDRRGLSGSSSFGGRRGRRSNWYSSPAPGTTASSSSMSKSSRYRTPPVGVRVGDTIHEESSG